MTDFLVDNRWLVLIAAVVVWAWFAWALIRSRTPLGAGAAPVGGRSGRVARPVSNRIAARKPGDVVPVNRTTTAGLAPSIEAGIAEHHLRSAAATTKLSSQPVDEKQRPTEALLKAARAKTPAPASVKDEDTPKQGAAVASEDDAKDSLFAGLGEVEDRSTEGPGTHAIKNAARMEEKGFHHQIESDQLPAIKEGPPVESMARAPAIVTAPAPITPPPIEPAVGVPAKPRSQTAELDDILKRIDQVLAETPTAPPPVAPAPPKPPTAQIKAGEKIDPNDVLRRIDEALAESQGDRAGQMTVPRPDWARDAERSAEETLPRPDWNKEAAKAPEAPPRPPLEPPRQTPPATKAAEITVPRPDWADEAKQRAAEDEASRAAPIVPAAPPAPTQGPAAAKRTTAAEAVPDWARGDLQDEDLDKRAKDAQAKPEKPADQGTTEGESGPKQQKLF